MPASLSEFSAKVKATNLVRPYLFYVEITKPPVIRNQFDDNELVSMYCHSAMTPQLNLLTHEDYNEAGVRRKFVYEYDYQNLLLHFMIDQEFNVKYFFDTWFASIAINKRNFGYYDDYKADFLNLYIINQHQKETYKYTYKNVVPKTNMMLDMSTGARGNVSNFTVEFVFEEVIFSKMDGTLQITVSEPSTTNLVTRKVRTVTFNKEYAAATGQEEFLTPEPLLSQPKEVQYFINNN